MAGATLTWLPRGEQHRQTEVHPRCFRLDGRYRSIESTPAHPTATNGVCGSASIRGLGARVRHRTTEGAQSMRSRRSPSSTIRTCATCSGCRPAGWPPSASPASVSYPPRWPFSELHRHILNGTVSGETAADHSRPSKSMSSSAAKARVVLRPTTASMSSGEIPVPGRLASMSSKPTT